jgi:hypothetical protein
MVSVSARATGAPTVANRLRVKIAIARKDNGKPSGMGHSTGMGHSNQVVEVA